MPGSPAFRVSKQAVFILPCSPIKTSQRLEILDIQTSLKSHYTIKKRTRNVLNMCRLICTFVVLKRLMKGFVMRQWRIQRGFRVFAQTPFETELFHFHGEICRKIWENTLSAKINKSNPPLLIWSLCQKILDLSLWGSYIFNFVNVLFPNNVMSKSCLLINKLFYKKQSLWTSSPSNNICR